MPRVEVSERYGADDGHVDLRRARRDDVAHVHDGERLSVRGRSVRPNDGAVPASCTLHDPEDGNVPEPEPGPVPGEPARPIVVPIWRTRVRVRVSIGQYTKKGRKMENRGQR